MNSSIAPHREEKGSKVFIGLSAIILGGLLFAAGVMVGQGLALDQKAGAGEDLLGSIDRRDQDRKKADGGLGFHETLEENRQAKAEKKKIAKPVSVEKKAAPPVPAPKGMVLPDHGDGKFSLQIASYRDASQAKELQQKLRGQGFSAVRLVEGDVAGKGRYFRVRLGRFKTRSRAEEFKRRLMVEHALDALLVIEDM